jgi:hypothetical protein
VTLTDTDTLTLTGASENASGGVIRVTRGSFFAPTGPFMNRGLIDVISGRFQPPAGFVNEGVILDASTRATLTGCKRPPAC